jgi:16S rRNA G966 N2-methylase RsmD
MSRRQRAKLLNVDAVSEYLAQAGLSTGVEETAARLVAMVDQQVQLALTAERNRRRLHDIDEKKQAVAAAETLTDEQIAALPRWVREQIADATIVGTSGDVIRTPDARKYHRKNALNDLSGGEWTYFLNSVISTRYPTNGPEAYAHGLRKVHPSPKPPQLTRQIIEFFTKEGEVVLDYFMGVGGTLLGASLAGRRALGVDLSQEYIDVYREAADALGLAVQPAIVGDALEVLEDPEFLASALDGDEISLVLIDPPYGDMMARPKTGESAKQGKETEPTPFTASDRDLGNMTREAFMAALARSVDKALDRVRSGGHVVVFMKDLQPSSEGHNLLHAEVVEALGALPRLKFLGMKIWADQSVNLYPYGYPYAFVANQIHQYILVFQKPRESSRRGDRGKDRLGPVRGATEGEGS